VKIRRTLLTAGVFALLAMIYVPTPHQGYRLIFSQSDTSIAFFQLLLNVGFAALLGAILATIIPKLPWWAWRGITGIAVIALLCIGGVAWRNFTAAAANRARFDEEFADSQLAYHYPDAAKFTLRNAARNWRLALRFDEATRVESRINKISQPAPYDWQKDPVVQAPAQAPQASPASGNPFDQFDSAALGSEAANPRVYRVTGVVLEVNDSMIAMQKGKDRWEIGRNSNTKVTGDLKVGAKVTITYTLTATGMEVESVFNPDAFIASHGQPVPRPSPSPAKGPGPWEDYTAQGQPAPMPKKYISTDPNAGEPIPRARPVRSPSPR
jgi:hypothetical protein